MYNPQEFYPVFLSPVDMEMKDKVWQILGQEIYLEIFMCRVLIFFKISTV